MKRIFLWIDDEREINTRWTNRNEGEMEFVIARTYDEAISKLNQCKEDKIFISFDHDLGIGLTGYDIAKYIVEFEIPVAGFAVHSMNPVGAANIIQILEHYGYYKMKFVSDIYRI